METPVRVRALDRLSAFLQGMQVFVVLIVVYFKQDLPKEVEYKVKATSLMEAGSKAAKLAAGEYPQADVIAVKRPLTSAQAQALIKPENRISI